MRKRRRQNLLNILKSTFFNNNSYNKSYIIPMVTILLFLTLICQNIYTTSAAAAVSSNKCNKLDTGKLLVKDSLVVVERKVVNSRIAELKIKEERNLGSLTCHILRDSEKPIYSYFSANASTRFSNAGTYDPYSFGKKRTRLFNCDIFLNDAGFKNRFVDLEVVLILEPLLGRNGQNVCDVPVIAKETVKFEFLDNTTPFLDKSTSSYTAKIVSESTTSPIENGKIKTFDDQTPSPQKSTSTLPKTTKWWWRTEKKNITIDVNDDSNSNGGESNNLPVNTNIKDHNLRDGFFINNDHIVDKLDRRHDENNNENLDESTESSYFESSKIPSREDNALKNKNEVQNGNKNEGDSDGINQNESIDRIGKLYDVDPNNSNENPGPASNHNNVHGVTSKPRINSTVPTVLLGGGPQIKNKDGQRNHDETLFWVIFSVILLLALALVASLMYYCCPTYLCCCCESCYKNNKRFSESVNRTSTTGELGNLTFVSVRDGEGRPIRDASSVQVWNTNRKDVKTYPVGKPQSLHGSHDQRSKSVIDALNRSFANEKSKSSRTLENVILTNKNASPSNVDPDGLVLIEDNRGNSDVDNEASSNSPVMVRVLRAVTPSTLRSWGRQNSKEGGSSRNRIFQLIKTGYEERRSGKDRSDLQILTLDDTLTTNNMPNKSPNNQSVNVDRLEETFRREGNAEILELSHSTLGDSVGGDDSSERIRSRQLDVVQEEEAEQAKANADSKSPNSYNELQGDAMLTRSTTANTRSSIILLDNNRDNVSPDMKSVQTDKSYGRANKRIQTQKQDEINDKNKSTMSNDDTLNSHGSLVGSANSSISNIDDLSDKHSENISPRLHQLVRVGPDGRPEIVGRIVGDDDMDVIEGNGFLNMAMHTLAQGRQGHTITAPINENRPLTATAGDVIPIFDPASQRYIWLPARDYYIMKQTEAMSDIESEGGIGVRRRRPMNGSFRDDTEFHVVKKHSDSIVNYGHQVSPPGTPNYTETKASILRRRKNTNVHANDGYGSFGGYNGGARKLTKSKSQSLSELSNLAAGGDTVSLNGGSNGRRKFSRHRPEIQRAKRGDKRSINRQNSLPFSLSTQ